MSTLERINADRRRHGLAPLKRSRILALYARRHSEKMCRAGDLFHGSPGVVLTQAKVRWNTYGENVGVTATGTVDGVSAGDRLHDAFMGSPGHRKNVLNPRFRRVGIGWYSSGAAVFVTETFFG